MCAGPAGSAPNNWECTFWKAARRAGVRLENARIESLDVTGGRVNAVRLSSGATVATRNFINAAGPLLKPTAKMLGIDLPVHCELHLKVAFKDSLAAIPRHAPLLIWTDLQYLEWSPEERSLLESDPDTAWLLEQMPAGAHTRPEGGAGSDIALMLWEYHVNTVEPVFPPRLDDQYPEIALRGMAAMLPAIRAYFGRSPRPILDGGYYTKTIENRPLIGPLPVQGAYVIGALSGYGLMAACAAGELLAAHLTGSSLPAYASSFVLERYSDPGYQAVAPKLVCFRAVINSSRSGDLWKSSRHA